MRRSGLASSGPCVSNRRKLIRAVIEACEPRMLLSITPGVNPFSPYSTFIDGTVFLDTNNNGVIDAADTPTANQGVVLEQIILNHNVGAIYETLTSAGPNPFNILPVGEYEVPSYASDPQIRADPASTFLTFPLGTYHLRCDPSPGFAVETSGSPGGQQDIVIDNFSFAYYNADFLIVPQATVSGTVFNDANGNGIQDPGETGTSGRTVWVDVNKNGVLDAGDQSAITDASGNYIILQVPPGAYTVNEINPAGTSQTSPPSIQYAYMFSSAQNITGANFGTTGPDLTVSLLSAPPTTAIGTYPTRQPAVVSITNSGHFAVDELVGVPLFLSLDTTLDVNDYQIGGIQGKRIKLKPGQSKTERIKYTVPGEVPTGNYHLIAEVLTTAKDSKPTNDTFASTQTIAVSQPTMDVAVSYPGTQQLDVSVGKGTAIAVNITNNGNVMFNGDVRLLVYASTIPSIDAPVLDIQPVTTVLAQLPHTHLKLHPHQTKTLVIPIVFTGLDRQFEFLITTMDVTDSLGDSSAADNTAVTTLPTQLR
jgi:hypothetical protein